MLVKFNRVKNKAKNLWAFRPGTWETKLFTIKRMGWKKIKQGLGET